MTILFAYAATIEGEAIASELGEKKTVELGVGKIQAAVTLSMELMQRQMRGAPVETVIHFGVAGAFAPRHLPAEVKGLSVVGQVCLVECDCLADEGVWSEEEFSDLATLGLAEIGPWWADAVMTQELANRLDLRIVKGATVSTCSANDSLAREIARRSGAQIETMEGAAVAWVCRKFAVPFVQLRSVSNWTGDRKRGHWDLSLAVSNVQRAVRKIDLVELKRHRT